MSDEAKGSGVLMRVLRRIGVRGGVSLTSLGLAQGLQVSGALPQSHRVHLWALAMMVFGFIYSLRHAVHRRQGYHRVVDKGAQLRRCMWVDASLCVAWIAAGAIFWQTNPSALVQVGVAMALYFAVGLTASSTLLAARQVLLPRGSDVIKYCWGIRSIKPMLGPIRDWPFFGSADRALNDDTPPEQPSAFVRTMVLVLLAVAAANAPAATLEGVRILDRLGAADSGSDSHQAKADQSKAQPPDQGPPSSMPTVSTPTAPAPVPTPEPYPVQCGGNPDPGDAPEPLAGQLGALWIGGHGIDGLGAVVAGCAQKPQPVRGHPDVWWERGMCDGHLRSLGIGSPTSPPQMLLQQAAVFAEGQAEDGHLLGASAREAIHGGDFQVVLTDRGSYVLIRSQTAAGTGGPAKPRLVCSDLGSENVAYTQVPPGLISLWLQVLAEGWAWPVTSDGGQHFQFVSGAQPGKSVAEATCSDEQTCTLDFHGLTTSGSAGAVITAAQLRALDPPQTAKPQIETTTTS